MQTTRLTSMTNIDGKITLTEEACVPVLDRGFLYGDSVYEVFRTYAGVPLYFAQHWERLENSARLIYMHIAQTRADVEDEIRRTIKASEASEAREDVYVRYTVTRGEGPVNLYADPNLRTRYVITVKELPVWNPEFYSTGMKAAIPSVRRNPVNALDPNIKGGNYLNNVLAVTQARELGADESIILNRQNVVTEASNSNAFFLIDDELVTPTPGAGNLAGLTSQAVCEACARNGRHVVERDIHADELPTATECFVTSATRAVMPIVSLRLESGQVVNFPPGGGDVTRKAMAYYQDAIDAHIKENARLSMW